MPLLLHRASIPEIPDADLAIISTSHKSMLLLMSKIHISDRHHVRILDVSNSFEIMHIPELHSQ